MKTAMLILLGILIGGVLGVIGGGAVGTGLGAGAGIVTGLQAGACLAVETAREKGFVTAEQVDEIFAAAAESMRAETELGAATDFADTDAECQAVVARLREAAAAEQ